MGMAHFDNAQFSEFLEQHSQEGRDVQLYNVHGQTLFPVFNAVTGGLMAIAAVYPILRGEGDRCPKFEGSFPTEDGATRDLGNGWIAMCVLFSYDQTLMGKMTKLERAEDKLRALKSGSQGGN